MLTGLLAYQIVEDQERAQDAGNFSAEIAQSLYPSVPVVPGIALARAVQVQLIHVMVLQRYQTTAANQYRDADDRYQALRRRPRPLPTAPASALVIDVSPEDAAIAAPPSAAPPGISVPTVDAAPPHESVAASPAGADDAGEPALAGRGSPPLRDRAASDRVAGESPALGPMETAPGRDPTRLRNEPITDRGQDVA